MEIREAIILAAGESRRLSRYTRGLSKTLIRISGIPLFLIPIRILRSIGVNRFIIVTKPDLKKRIKSILKREKVSYKIVTNRYVKRENGYSLYLGLKAVHDNYFFLSMADHVYPANIPLKLIEDFEDDASIVIAGDADPILIDIKEATKILANKDGDVIKISKKLTDFNFIDAGVFIMNKKVIKVAEFLEKNLKVFSVADVVNFSISIGHKVKVSDITGILWMEVDTIMDLRRLLYGLGKVVLRRVFEDIGERLWISESLQMELSRNT